MESLMKYIGRISRCGVMYRSDKLDAEGLGGHQHIYILKICQNPGITQEQLSKLIYINKSNVARQLAILSEHGFVTRRADPGDRRVQLVYPTEKAMALYPKVRALFLEWNRLLTQDLSEEEYLLLTSYLERLLSRADSIIQETEMRRKHK